jgi:hypothetical protein
VVCLNTEVVVSIPAGLVSDCCLFCVFFSFVFLGRSCEEPIPRLSRRSKTLKEFIFA